MKLLLSMLIILLLGSNTIAQDIETIIRNKPQLMVNDYAHVLSKEERLKLEKKLELFNKKTSTQFAIVVLNTIGKRNLEETATRLFNSWGIGQKKKNNGLLILVAMNDRKIRIEVGEGLEKTISNAIAAQIINADIKPAFKEARYYDGLNKATTSLMSFAEKAFSDMSGPVRLVR